MSRMRKLTDFLISVLKSVFFIILFKQLKLFSEKELGTLRNVVPKQDKGVRGTTSHGSAEMAAGSQSARPESL